MTHTCSTEGCERTAWTGDQVLYADGVTRTVLLCAGCGSLANHHALTLAGAAIPMRILARAAGEANRKEAGQ